MSVRYSGDAEIRLTYDRKRRVYDGKVVDANFRYENSIAVRREFARTPTSSDAYDDAARRLAAMAQRWAWGEGYEFMLESTGERIQIRRGFQAPCPLEDL